MTNAVPAVPDVAGGGDAYWSARFPDLFAATTVDYANAELTFTVEQPPDDLISRIHCVAVEPDGRVIVCRSAEEWRFLPGGTREPGESIPQIVARELLEEAGAKITGTPQVFAAQIADSRDPEPWRPHLPHPRAYWAFAVVTAEIVQPPSNPEDGEQVVEVLSLPPRRAADWLRVHDPTCADVVLLAAAMGLITG